MKIRLSQVINDGYRVGVNEIKVGSIKSMWISGGCQTANALLFLFIYKSGLLKTNTL